MSGNIEQASKGPPRTDSKSYNLSSLRIVPVEGMDKSTDIMYLMQDFSLYDDMYSPTVSGEVRVIDSNDLIRNSPYHGFEYIVVEFSKPGVEKKIKKTFRIYKIDNISVGMNRSTQGYSIRFCSEELIMDAQIKISKSYKGKLLSDIIKDVLNKILKVKSDKIGTIEATEGIQNIIIPNYNPFRAIAWLVRRATPIGVFWEHLHKGFTFASFKTLFAQKSKADYAHGYPNVSREPYTHTQPADLNPLIQVFQYEYLRLFDVLESISSGTYAGRLITIDPLKLKFEEVNLDYKKQFGSIPHVDSKGSPFIASPQDRFGKGPNEYPLSYLRMYPTTKSDQHPNKVEEWLLQSNMKLWEINHFKVKLAVPGNIELASGDLIKFTAPSLDEKDPNGNNQNEYQTGQYLITAIHHKIEFKSYEMIIEAVRDCVSKSYPGGNSGGLSSE